MDAQQYQHGKPASSKGEVWTVNCLLDAVNRFEFPPVLALDRLARAVSPHSRICLGRRRTFCSRFLDLAIGLLFGKGLVPLDHEGRYLELDHVSDSSVQRILALLGEQLMRGFFPDSPSRLCPVLGRSRLDLVHDLDTERLPPADHLLTTFLLYQGLGRALEGDLSLESLLPDCDPEATVFVLCGR